MGKFCSKCGRPLADGEVCNCQAQPVQPVQVQPVQPQQVQPVQPVQVQPVQPQQQVNVGQPVQSQQQVNVGQPVQPQQQVNMGQPVQPQQQQMNMGQPVYVQQAPSAFATGMSKVGSETANLFKKIIPIFKNPVKESKEIAGTNQSGLGIKMVIANLLVSLVVVAIALLCLSSKLEKYGMSGVDFSTSMKMILGTLFISALDYFGMAGLLVLTTKVFFKANTSFAHMISFVGVKALIDACFLLVGCIIMFISPTVGIFLILLGGIYSTLILVVSYAEFIQIDGSLKVYSMMITMVVLFIVFYVLYRIGLGESLDALSSFSRTNSLYNIGY